MSLRSLLPSFPTRCIALYHTFSHDSSLHPKYNANGKCPFLMTNCSQTLRIICAIFVGEHLCQSRNTPFVDLRL